MNSARRVARFTNTGRPPEASGSSVPPCPIWRVPRIRFNREMTEYDEPPTGLKILRIPSVAISDPVLEFDMIHDVDQVGTTFDRIVPDKLEVGSIAHVDGSGQFPA